MGRPEWYDNDLNLEATELRLGLPGRTNEQHDADKIGNTNKTGSYDQAIYHSGGSSMNNSSVSDCPPPSKAQIVGWPPIRSYRKNSLQTEKTVSGTYVKVSMDGAPYLRKIDLKVYKSYAELLQGLQTMFKICIGKYSGSDGYNGSEFAPTYQDKDGDCMLVGDVPWEIFVSSCKRLSIMKSSQAKGLGC